ncbi:MAG: ribosome recycling factor [Defluviitaleaceae bacterium]|nr:ribosome recycling factor [Defluviitaleaceae bacterium]
MTNTKEFESRMKKTISVLEEDFEAIRVGRANPRVLDKLTINYYGTDTPLSQVGNITVPEARLLQIAPWEANILKDIEKAIQASDLGLNPSNDGKVIRLTFPELTEERRKQLAKDVKKKGEDAKVAIRNIRRDAMDAFKKSEKKGDLTEDDLKNLEKETQDLTDKNIAELDKKVEAKTKEIMTV